MTRRVVVTLDQLYRPQPGGIGTYVRGLLLGLASLSESDFAVRGLVPSGEIPSEVADLGVPLVAAPLNVRLLTRLWSRTALGVPDDAEIVHATSMAGPFSGGTARSVHSVGMHDLLWRDESSSSTRSGVRYHESRLRAIVRREELRVFTSSPGLKDRLISEGIRAERIHHIRLGVDDDGVEAASTEQVAAFLASHGVTGPFTFYAGTREPRKNLARLVAAHRNARLERPEMGPLVLAGPSGWGPDDTGEAVSVGLVTRSMLKGLFRAATIFAYVPRAEGWGLPPVEALHEGARVVVSATTPSVAANPEVVVVDPLDVSSIGAGLLRALDQSDELDARERRIDSVGSLTWRNCALDHVEGWS